MFLTKNHRHITLKLKQFIVVFFIFTLISSTQVVFASEYDIQGSDLVGESAVLINQDTGQVLFDKNANQPMFPASTTKILTAIILLEDKSIDEIVTIDDHSPYAGGSAIALVPGEQLTVFQLLNALLITSANDAAEALAIYHSGSIEAFANVMNTRAAEMGAINSNFVNPHGMPDPNHVTTAYDLSMIAKYAMKNETFRQIVKTTRFEIPPTNLKSETRYLNGTNSFYQGLEGSNEKITVRGKKVPIAYEYVTGIKRGYTDEAQSCLVSSATIDNRSYISVVLKSNGNLMYQDTRLLLDLGLFGVKSTQLFDSNTVIDTVSLNDSKKTQIPLISEIPIVVDLSESIDPSTLIKKINIQSDIDLPVKAGEKLGTISVYNGDTLLLSTPLVSQNDFSAGDLLNNKTTFFSTQDRPLFSLKWFLFIFTRVFIALILWRTIMTFIRLRKLKRKKKQKKTTQPKLQNTSK